MHACGRNSVHIHIHVCELVRVCVRVCVPARAHVCVCLCVCVPVPLVCVVYACPLSPLTPTLLPVPMPSCSAQSEKGDL